MPPRQYLTEKQKWQAIGMVQAGQSQNQVARFFGKSKSVISRLVTLHRQTGNVTMRRGRGRLKKTTVRQDGLIRTVALRNRFVTAPEIKREFRTATGIRPSNSTASCCWTEGKTSIQRRDHDFESPTSTLPMGSTPPDTSFASLASCHAFRRIQVLSEVYRWT